MKRTLMLLFASVLVIGLLAGCGGGNEAFPKTPEEKEKAGREKPGGGGEATIPVVADEAAAMETYKSKTCAGCHADDLSGNAGPDLTKIGSELTPEQILDIIKNGKGIMPGGLAKGDEAANLAAYLGSLK